MNGKCRLCLLEGGMLIKIFNNNVDNDIHFKIMNCIGILVKEDDGITNLICSQCFLLVKTFSELRSTAIRNDLRLKDELEKSRLQIPTKEEIMSPKVEESPGRLQQLRPEATPTDEDASIATTTVENTPKSRPTVEEAPKATSSVEDTPKARPTVEDTPKARPTVGEAQKAMPTVEVAPKADHLIAIEAPPAFSTPVSNSASTPESVASPKNVPSSNSAPVPDSSSLNSVSVPSSASTPDGSFKKDFLSTLELTKSDIVLNPARRGRKKCHPSIKEIRKKYPKLKIPKQCYKLNMDPKVIVNNKIVSDWSKSNKFVPKIQKTWTVSVGEKNTLSLALTKVPENLNNLLLDYETLENENIEDEDITDLNYFESDYGSAEDKDSDEDYSPYDDSINWNTKSRKRSKCFSRNPSKRRKDRMFSTSESESDNKEKPKESPRILDLLVAGEADKTFICQTCNKVFDSGRMLKWHLKKHPKDTLRCQTCSETFPIVEDLIKHNSEKHSDQPTTTPETSLNPPGNQIAQNSITPPELKTTAKKRTAKRSDINLKSILKSNLPCVINKSVEEVKSSKEENVPNKILISPDKSLPVIDNVISLDETPEVDPLVISETISNKDNSTSGTKKPETVREGCMSGAKTPETGLESRTSAAKKPETTRESSISGAKKLEAGEKSAISGTKKPEMDVNSDISGMKKSDADLESSISSMMKSEADLESNISSMKKPETDLESSIFDSNKPEVGLTVSIADEEMYVKSVFAKYKNKSKELLGPPKKQSYGNVILKEIDKILLRSYIPVELVPRFENNNMSLQWVMFPGANRNRAKPYSTSYSWSSQNAVKLAGDEVIDISDDSYTEESGNKPKGTASAPFAGFAKKEILYPNLSSAYKASSNSKTSNEVPTIPNVSSSSNQRSDLALLTMLSSSSTVPRTQSTTTTSKNVGLGQLRMTFSKNLHALVINKQLQLVTSIPNSATSLRNSATSNPNSGTSNSNIPTSIPNIATSIPNNATSSPNNVISNPNSGASLNQVRSIHPNSMPSLNNVTSRPNTATSIYPNRGPPPSYFASRPNVTSIHSNSVTSRPNTVTSIYPNSVTPLSNVTSRMNNVTSTHPSSVTSRPNTVTSIHSNNVTSRPNNVTSTHPSSVTPQPNYLRTYLISDSVNSATSHKNVTSHSNSVTSIHSNNVTSLPNSVTSFSNSVTSYPNSVTSFPNSVTSQTGNVTSTPMQVATASTNVQKSVIVPGPLQLQNTNNVAKQTSNVTTVYQNTQNINMHNIFIVPNQSSATTTSTVPEQRPALRLKSMSELMATPNNKKDYQSVYNNTVAEYFNTVRPTVPQNSTDEYLQI